jgi:hypothetical protein
LCCAVPSQQITSSATQRSPPHRSIGCCIPRLLEVAISLHPDAPTAPALLGSAGALRERWHLPAFPAERAEYERMCAAVRAKHAGLDFERDVAAGRALTRDEAISMALALVATTGKSRAN